PITSTSPRSLHAALPIFALHSGAEDVLAEVAALVRLVDRLLQDDVLAHHLAADIDVVVHGLERVRGDQDPLDQEVRIPVHELAVDRKSTRLNSSHRTISY